MRTLRDFIVENYHLRAHHLDGTTKFVSDVQKAHHVRRNLDSLKNYSRDHGEDYNVSVHNKKTGEVHHVSIRGGQYKHGAPVIEAEDIDKAIRDNEQMSIRHAAAKNRSEARKYWKIVEKLRAEKKAREVKAREVKEDAVAANAMGASSSVAGSGAVDTFDPMLGARRARKKILSRIWGGVK